jgi:CMP/dCMP kinase
MAVITFSRLIGTGADTIAMKVAKELGYEIVDKVLILKVAKLAGITVDKTIEYDEKTLPWPVEFLKSLVIPNIDKFATGEKYFDCQKFSEYAKKVILDLRERGNVVIVGRGAQYILKDFKECFHVRIIADEKFRIERVKNFLHVDEPKARDIIAKSDSQKRNFIDKHFHINWDDPIYYNLILNSSKLGIDETANIIINEVKRFSTLNEYIPVVKDRRKGERRSDIDNRLRDRRKGETFWTIKDKEKAIMTGHPTRVFTNRERRKVERRKEDRRKSG